MANYTLTLRFTEPINESVNVGDVAYYVYTGEDGGFDVNTANIVEIGEIIELRRDLNFSAAPTPYAPFNSNFLFGNSTSMGGNHEIVCKTTLAANELEIGCGKTTGLGNQSLCAKLFEEEQAIIQAINTLEGDGHMGPANEQILANLKNQLNKVREDLERNNCEITTECGPAYILFSKNNCQEFASLLGYYGLFKFKNTSSSEAELFNVTVDSFESSK